MHCMLSGTGPGPGTSKRTVDAPTRRIARSMRLILLVCTGSATAVIDPHGVHAGWQRREGALRAFLLTWCGCPA
jgi:hypothetical protein